MDTNKIALVTGGSRGLGKNTALQLAKSGTDVVITYLSHEAEAQAVVAEIASLGRKAVALQLDTGKTGTFPAFTETLKVKLQDNWGVKSD